MRIVCQKCSAAYAIDDKFVTPKGVRAQCPRCRHLQLVKLEAAVQEVKPGEQQRTQAKVSQTKSDDPSAFLFDLGAPPPPPAAQGRDQPANDSPFDFAAVRTPAAPPAAPSTSQPLARLSASPFPAKPPKPVVAQEAMSHVVGVKCRTCGKELSDAFDQALGVCDACRNAAAQSEPEVPLSEPPAPQPGPSAPLFPPPSTPIAAEEATKARSAAREGKDSAGQKRKAISALGMLLVIGGLVALVVVKRPWAPAPLPRVVKPIGPTPAVDSIIQQWRLKYPDVQGASPAKLVEEGEALLVKDTPKDYLMAEERFQRALARDPTDDRALAGWVLAMVFGRADQIDEAMAKEVESMLAAAEQRSGSLRVFVAKAHFLIVRSGNTDAIKLLADRALSSKDPKDKALAALALGQALLSKDIQQAAQQLRDAQAADPENKRTYFFQAQLAVAQGNYREAAAGLRRRLELDADQWEASEILARLLVDVGELGEAKKVLEAAKAAAPGDAKPRLKLAMLAYQHFADLKAGEEQLTSVIDDPSVSKQAMGDALVHLSAIQRMKGDLAKAAETIQRAEELNRDSVPAKLQKFLILIERHVSSSARLELDGFKGKLGDKHLEAALEGRLLIAENRLDDAIQILAATAEAEPRRVDAILLGGAAAAKARKDGKAWEFCLRRGLRADPYSRPVPPLTDLFVRPVDLLRGAVGAYAALIPNPDEDPSPSLCEGLVAWFSEDFGQAERHFAKATNIDRKNAEGHAYRAFLALRRKDAQGALKLSALALDASGTSALAFLAQAQALVQANKIDMARVAALSSMRHGPQLLGPKVILGDAEANQKNMDEARRVLTTVLLSDPLYREAKRILYKRQL